jgi:hypothetical protein
MKTTIAVVEIHVAVGGSDFAAETSLAPSAAPAGIGLLLEHKFEEDVVDSPGNQRHAKVQGDPQFGEARSTSILS